MNIYFSGISGTGMGPLAKFTKDAGHQVFGSDLATGVNYQELVANGIKPKIGPQDGAYLQKVHQQCGLDWFVFTSALPSDHPELLRAKKLGLKTSKRDVLINFFINHYKLQSIAVAGTHGKTTTTAMMAWTLSQLGLPVSYLVGTMFGSLPSGRFDPGSNLFVYECDEYDRNFLCYHPFLSLIPSIDYDHPDTYKTRDDYQLAFRQFARQSQAVIAYRTKLLGDLANTTIITTIDKSIKLTGRHNRANATLVLEALRFLGLSHADSETIHKLNTFPGSSRRFERLADGLYTDYAHHPDEIAATIQMASELSDKVAVVYQPHQNIRQHQIRQFYPNAFKNAKKVLWLPTYLSREDPHQPVLTPNDFVEDLPPSTHAEPAELGHRLLVNIHQLLADGYLVVLMSAGPADAYLRQNLDSLKQPQAPR
jgi:UDP-N-acetylmuramate--alanine ligase